MSAPAEMTAQRARSETALAILSLLSASLHMLGEGYYHVRWGQPFYALFPDIVAMVLLFTGGLRSLAVRPGSAAGLLAGGWGFVACLAYRAVFERVASIGGAASAANGEPPAILSILELLAIYCAAGFVWSLRLAWSETRSARTC